MRLDQMLAPDQCLEEREAVLEFARQAGLGLASYDASDLTAGNLTLIFALSAWIRSSGIGALVACSSLLRLRSALLEVSGLDSASEPVPLLAGDVRSALIGLSIYLHGLIRRSARHLRRAPASLVEEAVQVLF